MIIYIHSLLFENSVWKYFVKYDWLLFASSAKIRPISRNTLFTPLGYYIYDPTCQLNSSVNVCTLPPPQWFLTEISDYSIAGGFHDNVAFRCKYFALGTKLEREGDRCHGNLRILRQNIILLHLITIQVPGSCQVTPNLKPHNHTRHLPL